MNYSLETFNEASVGGWVRLEKRGLVEVKAAAVFLIHRPSNSPSLLFTSLSLISTFRSYYPPVFFFLPHSFLSTPPSSLQTFDTTHIQPFVYQRPFYCRVKSQKSIYESQVHLMATLHVEMFTTNSFIFIIFLCVLGFWIFQEESLSAARFVFLQPIMKSLLP